MATALIKTWRKDSMTIPDQITAVRSANDWLLWAWKELLLTGSDGAKGGPNAWTVVGSCDSTQYAMDGTDYLTDYTKMVSSGSAHSWIVLRNANLGAGSGLELCLDYRDDTTYEDEISVIYSWSAGFTGGSTTARPTATDEYACITASNDWPGFSSYQRSTVCRLMSTDGENYRIFTVADGATRGCLFLEKMQNVPTWVDENFLLHVNGGDLDLGELSTAKGFYFRNSGAACRARIVRPGCKSGYISSYAFGSRPGGTGIDAFGKYQLFPALVANITSPNYGFIGTVPDMYLVEATLPVGFLMPHSLGEKGFISYDAYVFGNDGTPGFG